MVKRFKILFFVICFIQLPLSAQNNSISSRQISTANGLSSNSIACIYKDSRGFIWIGTSDGLNRYDGHEFIIYRHNRLDPNTISDNFISSIIEDYEGNLWIGTQGGGLNKFNPTLEKFTSYIHQSSGQNSLSSNFIFPHKTLVLDQDSILWIGTDAGLCSYHINKQQFQRIELFAHDNPDNKPTDIRVILEDPNADTVLWIGTDLGLIRYHKPTGKITSYYEGSNKISLSNNIINSLFFDNLAEKLWIGTEYGLNVIDLRLKNNTEYYHNPRDPFSLTGNAITSIVQDQSGNIWIGTKSGLNKYNINTKKFIRYTHDLKTESISDDYVDYLYFDDNGLLWLGLANAGVNVIETGRKKFITLQHDPSDPNSLSYNTIRSIYEDPSGMIWIGTYGGGLNRYNRNAGLFTHFTHNPRIASSISHNIVSAIYQKDNDLWIGTYGGGLNKMDLKSGKIIRNVLPVPEFVITIYEDTKNILWIGCNGGLFKYTPNTNKLARYDSEYEESRKLTATSVNSILEDSYGNYWVGTWNGLNKIIPNGSASGSDTIIHYLNERTDPYSLSDNRITSLYEDQRGTLWIATYGGGLNKVIQSDSSTRIDYEHKFLNYTENHGLPSNIIFGILEDKHHFLWLSTSKGISKTNPDINLFVNFDKSDGLQDDQFYWGANYRSRTGELIFGGINGLNIFHPDSITRNKQFPRMAITDFLIFNKSVSVGKNEEGKVFLTKTITETDEITLTHKDYAFSIEFAALTYTSQSKIQYAYKLENFNPEWIYTNSKRRFASYTNLKPGNYYFKVKSTNEDGIWSNEITQLKITVLPAFWETVWAFIIYGIILLLLLYFFRNHILVRARFKHDLQLERIEREKVEEYNNMKLSFFTNISHEFRNPLTLIIGPLERLISQGKWNKKVREQLMLMYRNSKRLLRLVNQLMDFRKVETGNLILRVQKNDLIKTIKEIVILFKPRAFQHNINYKIKLAKHSAIVWFDENVIETVVCNLLSNAFKYTPENGRIQLTVQFLNSKGEKITSDGEFIEFVELKVTDSGIGIPKQRLIYIFKRFYQIGKSEMLKRGTGIGLALCKDLIDLHHGEISVTSEPGEGTTFIVKLPVSESSFLKEEILREEEPGEDSKKLFSHSDDSEEFILIEEDTQFPEFSEPKNKNAPVVLIIEDDIEIIEYIGEILESDYKILIANNGNNGFDLAVNNEPDLIISDIIMPGMDGLELCQKIKTDIRINHIPVILLTALSKTEDRIKGIESGADSYIPKPFDPGHLQVRVKKLIEQRQKLRIHFSQEFNLDSEDISITSMDEKFLKKAIDIIHTNISDPEFTVESLGMQIGFSSTHLYRKLKALTGLSTNELIRKIRLRKAVKLIERKQGSISEIMYMTGFSSHSYFAKCFHDEFGITPKELASKVRKHDKLSLDI